MPEKVLVAPAPAPSSGIKAPFWGNKRGEKSENCEGSVEPRSQNQVARMFCGGALWAPQRCPVSCLAVCTSQAKVARRLLPGAQVSFQM